MNDTSPDAGGMRRFAVRDESDSRGIYLIAWTDIPDHEEADFNEWYNREHMRDRVLGLPGMRWGRRFCAIGHRPRYMAVYDSPDPNTFQSDEYVAMVRDPDPNSRRFMSQFQTPMRAICRRTVHGGEGEGAYISLAEASPAPGRENDLRRALAQTLLPGLLGERGMIAAWVLEKDEAALAASRRQHLRSGDRELDWAVIAEAQDPDSLKRAWEKHVPAGTLEAAGAARTGEPVLFQQLYRVSRG